MAVHALEEAEQGCKTKEEVRNHNCDDYNDVVSQEVKHMKCEEDESKTELPLEVNKSDSDTECGLSCELSQKSWMVMMNKRHKYQIDDGGERPRNDSNKRTGAIRGGTISKRKIVRSNRVGTISGVYDRDSTTHVDCVPSIEGSMGPPWTTNGSEDGYPWCSARSIKRWIEVEIQQPNIGWTIDNYDGAESLEEL